MHRIYCIAIFALLGVSAVAADFQSGQAARAVLGQNSFSAREQSLTPTALAISTGRLYAADVSHRVLTFDTTQIPAAKDVAVAHPGTSCVVCGFAPIATVPQAVFPGIASVATFGKTVIIADAGAHRVLIWRDSSLPRANKGPDVILGRANTEAGSISASTIVEPISVAYDGKRLFVGDGTLHRVLVWNSLPSFDNEPADAVLGQQSFATGNVSDMPAPNTLNRPTAIASDGTNTFVADGVDHRILVFSAGDTPLPADPVENSASFAAGPLAPGTLITISGRALSDETESAPDGGDTPLPGELAGTQVILNGNPLPLLSVSPAQVRAQLPYDLGGASAVSLYVRTEHDDGTVTTTNATAVKVNAATPGLFAFNGTEPRPGMILHADAESGLAGAPVTSENPAAAGEVLVLWAAGLGGVDAGDVDSPVAGVPYGGADAPVANGVGATVNGRPVQVLSATLPHGSVGIYEVRLQLPDDVGGDAEISLAISQEGLLSNTVTIPVQRIVH